MEHFRALNPALTVTEQGEWENITFREPKKLGPQDALPRTQR